MNPSMIVLTRKSSPWIALVLVASALGATPATVHASERSERAACTKARPTADERKLIQAAYLDAEKESVPLAADLKLALLDEKTLLASSDATFDSAQAASAKTADARAKLAAVKDRLRNTILYSILKPENRALAAKCFALGQSDARRNSRERRPSHDRRSSRRHSGHSGVDPSAPSTTPASADGSDPAVTPPANDPGSTTDGSTTDAGNSDGGDADDGVAT